MPTWLKVHLKPKEITDISQPQAGCKAKSRRNPFRIPRLLSAKSGCAYRNRRYFPLFSYTPRLMAAPCRKRARTGGQALYPGGCWVSGGWLMSPAPFPVVAECEYQQPCHRQRHADQQPQAWRVCTRVGQLRRFTVQNGKGHGVGVIGARRKRILRFRGL